MNDLKSRQKVTVGSKWAKIERPEQTLTVTYASEGLVYVKYDATDKLPARNNQLSMGYFLDKYYLLNP